MIRFRQKGDFSKLTRFLEKAKEVVHLGDLDQFGRAGVAAPGVCNACRLRRNRALVVLRDF